MITVDDVLLLSSWIEIEFIHRGFLFASISPLGAETDLPEANETKTSSPSLVLLFQGPAMGLSHSFICSSVFVKFARKRYSLFLS